MNDTVVQIIAYLGPAFFVAILQQFGVPAFTAWRKAREENKKISIDGDLERQKINEMQSLGWEKLYLIQEKKIENQQAEITELRQEIREIRGDLNERTDGVRTLLTQLKRVAPMVTPDYTLD